MNILVTGGAGFIGSRVAQILLDRGDTVICIDNFNDYYDPSLKEHRNALLEKYPKYSLYRGGVEDLELVKKVFNENRIDKVCHLAAQAGVRFSLKEPYRYIESNIVGFANILNEAKNFGVKDFIFASSSSVYGNQTKSPFSEDMRADEPISLYAATKHANEVIAYSYHHLYDMHCTGLRFFTVYGPNGRPDMAMVSFTKAILEGKPIQIFNNGDMRRDFTYVDDIADGVVKALDAGHAFEIINLGNNAPVQLMRLVELLEKELGKEAIKEFLPIQPGDVTETYADIEKAKEKLGWEPKTDIEEGIKKFVEWYKDYYKK